MLSYNIFCNTEITEEKKQSLWLISGVVFFFVLYFLLVQSECMLCFFLSAEREVNYH